MISFSHPWAHPRDGDDEEICHDQSARFDYKRCRLERVDIVHFLRQEFAGRGSNASFNCLPHQRLTLVMNGFRVHAEEGDQQKDNRDVNADSVRRGETLMRHNKSNRSNGDDDLEIPDLDESLSVLKQEGNRVGVLFQVGQSKSRKLNSKICSPSIPVDNFLERSSSAFLGRGR